MCNTGTTQEGIKFNGVSCDILQTISPVEIMSEFSCLTIRMLKILTKQAKCGMVEAEKAMHYMIINHNRYEVAE